MRCRKRGTDTIVTFADRVEKQNLYQRASFAAELEMPLEDVQRLRNSLEAPMVGR